MNEPTDSTDTITTTAPEDTPATEAGLRELAVDTDAGTPETPPPADDATPAAPAPDPEVDDTVAELTRLREEHARQKAEIVRLTHLTSLQGGSGPGTPPAAPKRFAELSEREMETEITRMAAEIDGF